MIRLWTLRALLRLRRENALLKMRLRAMLAIRAQLDETRRLIEAAPPSREDVYRKVGLL